MPAPRYVSVVDSHTAGEPTRVVVEGGPELGTGSVAERLERFRRDHDRFRSAVVNEPRGSDVLVGALLVPPRDPAAAAGVIFFNNVGMIRMCGHGTIGVVVTLAHLGRLRAGTHRIETCVGTVSATLLPSGEVRIENVPSRRSAKGASVDLEGHGRVSGDVAWGGNWFYLVEEHGQVLEPGNAEALTAFTTRIRRALAAQGVTGEDGAEIDHVELFSPSTTPGVHSRNFVLCPGLAYDRSPCGTGTSAKVACLYEDGKLEEGEVWRQEGIVGGVFEASVALRDGKIVPTIQGTAHVTAEARLVLDPKDPFVDGIRR